MIFCVEWDVETLTQSVADCLESHEGNSLLPSTENQNQHISPVELLGVGNFFFT